MLPFLPRRRFAAASLPALCLILFGASVLAQRAPNPEPTLIQDVYLGRKRDEAKKFCLLLRDGAIERILEAGTPAPPGVRVVDGRDLLCLPAFLDAYSNTGCETPEPTKDQDVPVEVISDVRIDMRQANRKGVQPAFRAVEAAGLEKEDGEAWRSAGFGAALIAPEGELLSGSSVLVSTREAAMRDLVVRSDVFAHGAFTANGSGYPSTLMGYIAQLRQFFHDANRQEELERRYAQGRPGPRPPYDDELAEGRVLLSRDRLLVCEAEGYRDMERWFKLADDFGFRVGFVGGREAWRVALELAERDVPVVLTLDWGKEVEDPLAKDKKKKDEGEEDEGEGEEGEGEGEEGEGEGEEGETPESEGAKPEDEEKDEEEAGEGEEASDEPVWEYDEPLGVRLERRRLWEERRDCALRLAETDVRFAFGSKVQKPQKLLVDVRKLVEVGLDPEAALSALTDAPARMMGVANRLGRVAEGYNATFCLWSEDPMMEKDAQVLWSFVDGFSSEYERKEKKSSGPPPDEDLDMGGTWTVNFPDGEGIKTARFVLEMDEEGNISGTFSMKSPADDSDVESPIEGALSGRNVIMEASVSFGEFQVDFAFEGKLDQNRLEGDATVSAPFMDEPRSDPFNATRDPEEHHVEGVHDGYFDDGHPHCDDV